MKKNLENNVEEYISKCPQDVQDGLMKIRAAIQNVAHDAIERTDYFQIPGYSYEGYDYNGMFVWFSYKKPNLRLHVRPPVIEEHKKDLVGCVTTKSIVMFPEDKAIPIPLVEKLVKASIKVMKDKS
jgi:uncharacterized protein YdhG (YjbR/CyaY superfamily)